MALLMELRSVQKAVNASIDKLMERVLAMEDAPPAPIPTPQTGKVEGVFNAKTSMRYLGVSATKFYVGIRQGIIPPGHDDLGPRSKRWYQSELDACLASRHKEHKEEQHDTEKKSGRTALFVPSARPSV